MIEFERELRALAGQLSPHLQRCLFYVDESNSYVLFNRYVISRLGEYHCAHRYGDDRTVLFNSLKNATVWCILDNEDKFYEARRVSELDSLLISVQMDKLIHSRLSKRGDASDRAINAAKLQHDCDKERLFQAELNKYTILARDCQQRRFEHETNRTGRKQKN